MDFHPLQHTSENTINGNIPTITENTTLGELIDILGPVTRAAKTPTSRKLQEEAGEPIAESDGILIYSNGYGVYDNGSGRTVVWIPSCVSFTYYFDKMKESEKGGEIKEYIDLPEGLLEAQPWVLALMLVGDHRIESLTMQRKADRKQNKTLIRGDNEEGEVVDEMEEREDSLAKEYTWREDQIGEDPETIYIRKETRQEMLDSIRIARLLPLLKTFAVNMTIPPIMIYFASVRMGCSLSLRIRWHRCCRG